MTWLWNKIVLLYNEFTQWLFDLLEFLPRKIFSDILDALASVVEKIPVPDFFITAQGAFGSIPSSVLFFANKFALGEGVAMILAAYLIRFTIRRIPIIG